MDNQEARFILQASRPGGTDDADPQVRAAMEQAQQDPALQQWFAEERAADIAISGKLKSHPVPEGLKAGILAGQRVTHPATWWRQPRRLALAASLVLLLSLVGVAVQSHRQEQARLAGEKEARAYLDYTAGVADFLNHLDRLDYQSKDPAQLQTWLASNQGHQNIQLTSALNHTAAIGCRVLKQQGTTVTLMCFRIGPDGWKDEVHLVVANRSELPGSPTPGDLVFRQNGQWTFASWSNGDKTYLLAGLKGPEELKKHL